MKTTGEFHLHSYSVKARGWNKPFYIAPIGDIHWGAPHCAATAFKRDIKACIDNPDCYLVGMGDYLEHISTSERETLRGRMHESFRATWEKKLVEETEELVELLMPMKKRIIGLVEGNHFGELRSGITTTQYMAQRLGTKYLGVMSGTRIKVLVGGHRRFHFDVIAHHGTGSARQSGASINSVERLQEVAKGKVYLMGHDHKKNASRTAKLKIIERANGGLDLCDDEQVSLRCGTYLRGYVDGEVCYIAEVAGRPSVIGHSVVKVTPERYTVRGVQHLNLRLCVDGL